MSLCGESSAQDEIYAIAIHGGAGGVAAFDLREGRLAELNRLLDQGVSMLKDGRDALDVVESVIKELEDHELFNAGRGCVLNDLGEHELDASIMDGRTLACGAVAAVKTTRHPISLARKVMTETKHVLLCGSGADEFGQWMGLEQAGPDHFVTQRQKDRYLRWKAAKAESTGAALTPPMTEQSYFGTVGCVVLDQKGNLAAGTSTGGLLGKRWGRIGDSPIVGAGNYADNNTCATSGTGIGEEFIRHAVASDIAARMRYAHSDLRSSVRDSIARLPENCGGVICVDRAGNVLAEHNTPAMAFAIANSKGVHQVQLQPVAAPESKLEGNPD